jgi:lipoprotein-releasing system permease protein
LRFSSYISNRIRHNEAGSFSATVSKIGVASIAICVAVGIMSFAILFGFKKTIQDKIFLFGSHLKVTSLTLGSIFEEGPIAKNTSFAENLSSMPEVSHWQAVAHKQGILKTSEELKGIIIKGVGADYDWTLFKKSLLQGRLIQLPDSGYSKEVIISKKIADQLTLTVGDDVLMYFVQNPPLARKLSVVGIYETQMEEFDNTLIIGDLALVQRLNNWGPDTVGSYEIYLKDFSKIDQAAAAIFDQMPHDLFLQKVTETLRPVFDWLLMLDRNTGIFLTLILFVASFNMISILLVMIMERTPLIGLLKTMGSPNSQIRQIFAHIGIQMVVKGLIIGNVLSLGLCWIQHRFGIVKLDPVNYFMDSVPIVFDWPTILLVNLLTLIFVGAVLFIPTYVITRIQPIRAMLFKK